MGQPLKNIITIVWHLIARRIFSLVDVGNSSYAQYIFPREKLTGCSWPGMKVWLTPVSSSCWFVLLVHGKKTSPYCVPVKWPVFPGRGRVTEVTSGAGWSFVHSGKPGPFRTWTSQSANVSIVVFTSKNEEAKSFDRYKFDRFNMTDHVIWKISNLRFKDDQPLGTKP